MPEITGIRDGHRVITTVTGQPGAINVDRQHHPHCPCRIETNGPDTTPTVIWPTYTLQRWNWLDDDWEARQTFTTSRGEGNASFAVQVERTSHTGPIRLLKDGVVEFEDNPETYYAEQPGW